MKLSSRVSRIGESATLGVARRAKELQRSGVEVVDLSAGEPDFPSPRAGVAAAKRALDEGFTRYTVAAGIPELRAALAEKYRRQGAPWGLADTVVTVGAKAALLQLFLALFEEGDEVVLPSPFWVSFPEQLRLAGAKPVTVQLASVDGFAIRSEPILKALSPRTRGVILNSPCNPTGGVMDGEELRRVVEACADRGIPVISDETYERFVYDGRAHASIAALASEFPETAILVGSFSKTYAMTGWRVGYALGPAPVIGALDAIQSHATSNPTSFAMSGALAALRESEPEVREMLVEYEARRDLVAERLSRIPGVECSPPAGAFYAFPRVSGCFRAGRRGSLALSEYLLEEARVAVVPGLAFGADEYLRISFACSRPELERGLERMARALSL